MNKVRVNLLFSFLFLLSLILSFRLYKVQITQAEHWAEQAERQQKINKEKEGERGSIFIRNREEETIPVAVNRVWKRAYISPRKIKEEDVDKEELISSLVDILELKRADIEEELKRDSAYRVLKNELTEEEINSIKDLDYPGVYLENQEKRFYPQQKLASHLIGFIGGVGKGQYGVEGYYNDTLKGTVGMVEGWRNPGRSGIVNNSAKAGLNIDLTVDYNIQFMAEKLIKEYVNDWNAKSGSVIAMNPKTGEVMALANYPDFDPNNYRQEKLEVFRNDTVQSLFEPGSIFKPLIMAMAIEEGAVKPDDTYKDKGHEVVSGYSLKNYNEKKHGLVTMTEVLEKSINTGMVYVQQELDNEVFLNYLEDYGFFEKTGVDLQGEVASQNLSFKGGYDVNFATASFGQGIEVTPIQLMSAFSSLANGGRWVRPYVADNFNIKPETKRVLSSGTTTAITSMLISTVENGTARKAQIPGYYIAGKTGTAQISRSALGESGGGYSDKTVQSFIGYGPLNAEFLILVKMEQPEAPTAEVSVVPVFKELAEYIINYKQIPPDYVRDSND